MEQRKLLLPAFHGESMQRLTGLMTELAEREAASWPRGETIALHPRLQRLTLEIILRAVFGLEQGHRLEELRDVLTEFLVVRREPAVGFAGVEPLPRVAAPVAAAVQPAERARAIG